MNKTLIALLLFVPSIALAAPRTFSELANLAVNIINGGIGIALILGIVIYFYGVSTSLLEISKGEAKRVSAHFVWGIIALFVMFSVWGILRLLSNTLFNTGAYTSMGGSRDQVICRSIEDCQISE